MKNKLGILGGGQLGMFICQAAKKHNIKTPIKPDTRAVLTRYSASYILSIEKDISLIFAMLFDSKKPILENPLIISISE